MDGPADHLATVDAIDARTARLVALLADRDQQLADRLVVTELAERLGRAEAALAGALARAVVAEEATLVARAETDRLTGELATAVGRLAELEGRSLVVTGSRRLVRTVARHLPRR